MQPGARIDYKTLRRINAEAARCAVLEYLAACGHNVTETARTFGITRPVVYAILAKQRDGYLGDRSRAPHRQPRKTPPEVEERVVAARNKTRLGPKRLSLYLAQEGPPATRSGPRNAVSGPPCTSTSTSTPRCRSRST